MIEDKKLNVKRLYSFARRKVGHNEFEEFLKRFGINHENQDDIRLEVLAQIKRMRRREVYYDFVIKFDNTGHNLINRTIHQLDSHILI